MVGRCPEPGWSNAMAGMLSPDEKRLAFIRNRRLTLCDAESGAEHEVLMERDAVREQFWAAFDAFIPGTRVGDEAAKGPVAWA